MGRLVPMVIPAWMLPAIVIALVIPGVAAFAVVGPSLGLAVGALTIGALVVVAARARFDTPIEVASSPDRRYRVLVVSTEPVAEASLVERIAAIAADGQALVDPVAEPELLVLAPALASRLDRWASDVAAARGAAHDALAISLAGFAAAAVDASGKVGDADPVQAIEDELHTFAAREVVIIDGPGLGPAEVAELRRRLDRPVRELQPQVTRASSSR
jgi:hypothetical protein